MAKSISSFQAHALLSIIGMLFLLPQSTHAWGARGHGLICEAAIHLINDADLKRYLLKRVQAITYLCNLPDTHWRSDRGAEVGGPTHFFESDVLGLTLEQIPVGTYQELEKMVAGKTNLQKQKPLISAAREMGSSWWRAEQFVRLAKEAGQKAATKKSLSKEDNDLFRMWVMMGLLGHFVGDNAQPFHTTMDYDGWLSGHGGIHSYYESDLVNELSASALTDILKGAKKAEKELQLTPQDQPTLMMKKLAILSFKDKATLLKLDPILQPSKLTNIKGLEIRDEAERKPASVSVKSFQPILTLHMTRGAVLLAAMWEQIYKNVGKVPLSEDKSFRFPHQYEFIPPDYLTAP
jgi:hypothetical protein